MNSGAGSEPMDFPDSRGLPVVVAKGVSKSFGHVKALVGADLTVHAGEIVGLLGDNGAGKSTLLKCVSGDLAYDEGSIQIAGRPLVSGSVTHARAMGVEAVYQDLALAADLDICDNVFLGHEVLVRDWRKGMGWLDRKSMRVQADVEIRGVGVALPSLRRRVDQLSGGQRQAVAIARAKIWAQQVILLDEPTAALGIRQAHLVDEMIRNAAASRLAVLLISHDVTRVLKLAHRIVVLRQGRVVRDTPAQGLGLSDVVAAMLGHGEGSI
jgi:simple sugar transport system ATP-binding protein